MLLRCSANGHCLWAPLVGSAVGLFLDWFAFLLLDTRLLISNTQEEGLANCHALWWESVTRSYILCREELAEGDFLWVLVLFLLAIAS